MERIIDIFGQSAYFNEDYQVEDSWTGRIVLSDNLTFEGIVEDYSKTEYFLIFGKIGKEGLEITKCTREDKEVPYFFNATEDDKKYYGDYYADNSYVKIPLGECRVIMIPAEATRGDNHNELRSLKKQIIEYKHSLGEIGDTLYKRFELARVDEKPKVKVNKTK